MSDSAKTVSLFMKEITPEIISRYFPQLASWIAGMERAILEKGQPLFPINKKDAEAIGIHRIEDVKIIVLQSIPLPNDRELSDLIQQTGVLSPQTSGMTFGHGIVLKDGAYNRQLIAHELVHVLQYERLGGIEPFLEAYIKEVAFPPGYPYGPLEQEATRVAASLL